MAAIEGALPFSVASVVEDVLQQHGSRSRGLDLDARRAEEDGKFLGIFLGEILMLEPEYNGSYFWFDVRILKIKKMWMNYELWLLVWISSVKRDSSNASLHWSCRVENTNLMRIWMNDSWSNFYGLKRAHTHTHFVLRTLISSLR